MPKRKKFPQEARKSLDTFTGKKRRGRRGVRRSYVTNSAYHYNLVFQQQWDIMGEHLLKAKTTEEVIQAFENVPDHAKKLFIPHRAHEIVEILRDPKFPQERPEAQIRFLGESLAGRGIVSPRRARDICAEERAKPKHEIIQRDFYIRCTCDYKGPALHGACPKCGTGTLAPSLQFRGLFPEE